MASKKWLGGTASFTTDFNTAANFSPASVPANGDDLYIEAGTGTIYSITTSLSALSAVTLSSINISQTYTGEIGTLGAYLQISATTSNIGYQFGGTRGNGSDLIRLNYGAVQNVTNVYNSRQGSALDTAGPITLLGTHTANTLNIISGIVTVAADPLEAAAFQTINTSGNLTCGGSVTMGTLNLSGGTALLRSSISVINQTTGTLYTFGTGTVATWNVNGGNAIPASTGTITSLIVGAGNVDMSTDPRAKTVTNCTLNSNQSLLNVNNGVKNSITFTNNITSRAAAPRIITWPNTILALS